MAKDLKELRADFVAQLQACKKNLENLHTQREQLRGAIFAMDQVLTAEPAEEVPTAEPAEEVPTAEPAKEV